MAANNIQRCDLDCPICMEPYNEGKQEPLVSRVCAHTVCKTCIDGIFDQNMNGCAVCRQPHARAFYVPNREVRKFKTELTNRRITQVDLSNPPAWLNIVDGSADSDDKTADPSEGGASLCIKIVKGQIVPPDFSQVSDTEVGQERKRERQAAERAARMIRVAELTCVVCMSPFEDAQVSARCGHSLCRECVEQLFASNGANNCPTCREPQDRESYVPNTAMNQVITSGDEAIDPENLPDGVALYQGQIVPSNFAVDRPGQGMGILHRVQDTLLRCLGDFRTLGCFCEFIGDFVYFIFIVLGVIFGLAIYALDYFFLCRTMSRMHCFER